MPKHRVTKSQKSGLKLPVSKLHRMMKARSQRLSSAAPVYMAGVLEYLLNELIEGTGIITKRYKKKRIQQKHIRDAIKGVKNPKTGKILTEGDQELFKLLSNHLDKLPI